MCSCAAVAQLVERKLPKLEVAGSNPVRRFAGRRLLGPITPQGLQSEVAHDAQVGDQDEAAPGR
jgi:hypothetical protein